MTFDEALDEVCQVGRSFAGYDDYYHGGAQHVRETEKEFTDAVSTLRSTFQREIEAARREGAESMRERVVREIIRQADFGMSPGVEDIRSLSDKATEQK